MLREPLKIHFGGQANLFNSGRRQEKAALALAKAQFPSLPEYKNLLLAAQKQLLELPLLTKQFRLILCSRFIDRLSDFVDKVAGVGEITVYTCKPYICDLVYGTKMLHYAFADEN